MDRSGFVQGISLVPGDFDKIWNDHTILVAPQSGGFGRSPMMPGFSRGGPQGGGSFELIIRATLMDSSVIDSGLNLYSRLASMSPEEKNAYKTRYNDEHFVGKYLFIWANVGTPFSDEYLKLDRWTFFLETESGQQIEPAKIVEHGISRQEFNVEEQPADTTTTSMTEPEPNLVRRRFPNKIVEFYFPLTNFDGVPLLSKQFKELKFGVVNTKKLEDKIEGAWNLETLRSKE